MRIHWNQIASRCLAALAAGVIAVSTFAGHAVTTQAAEAKAGTLTITPKVGDTVVDSSDYDGTFKVYKVADYDETGTFTATAGFRFENHETLLTSDNLSDERQFNEITQTITAWARNHSDIDAILSGVKAGMSNQLAYGLYLIMQDQSATNYTDATPFLVMIPNTADGKTLTDVTAYPKITKTTTPDTPETPDKPHKPHDNTPPTTPTKTGKVILKKVDAADNHPLADAGFELKKKSSDGDVLIGTYTTKENGEFSVENLSYGEYYFVEVKAPDDYILDQTRRIFTIDSENTITLTVTNAKEGEEETDTPHITTGDESNMILYGAVVAIAAAALAGWFLWKRRSEKETQ